MPALQHGAKTEAPRMSEAQNFTQALYHGVNAGQVRNFAMGRRVKTRSLNEAGRDCTPRSAVQLMLTEIGPRLSGKMIACICWNDLL